jgi:hypothetical protein
MTADWMQRHQFLPNAMQARLSVKHMPRVAVRGHKNERPTFIHPAHMRTSTALTEGWLPSSGRR